MKFPLIKQLEKTKQASKEVANLSLTQRVYVLKDLASILLEQKENIEKANKKDVFKAKSLGRNAAFIERLKMSEKVFENMLSQIEQIAIQKDFKGEIIEKRTLANGLILKKIRVPLGVIGIIYESRPNITIDVAALCIKSGNAVVLRGGSDAYNTNEVLINCIHAALERNHIAREVVCFIDSTDRKIITQMLKQERYIDVIIPRGGYDLVKKVVYESRIPVLYHASGGARIYIDKSADIELAVNVCINAKTSRPATCNSLDTIILHKEIAEKFLKKFSKDLSHRAEIRADRVSLHYIEAVKATERDYKTEFLDYIVSIKVVHDIDEALVFIDKYTKKHTEGIIAKSKKAINKFISAIDAAAIFVNSSTRLHDGGEFELGAEMGIATGKLHVRGPVGVKELTTYKWVAFGTGQIRL